MVEKQTSYMLENILAIDRNLQEQIKEKELKIKILEAEIEQLYEFIKCVQKLGKLENKRLVEISEENR